MWERSAYQLMPPENGQTMPLERAAMDRPDEIGKDRFWWCAGVCRISSVEYRSSSPNQAVQRSPAMDPCSILTYLKHSAVVVPIVVLFDSLRKKYDPPYTLPSREELLADGFIGFCHAVIVTAIFCVLEGGQH